uniref:RING-type domain-containing protein n=1 Tax=Anolis carolinensis TaxID=28377 RepID=H9GAH8_ANOCA|nr:PREDICTED: E3 ubiquitin-protein ligase RNF128 [Anolis carolinensis]|eukprot:XP_003229265.1 PREDICTED: E3 ubiquitin-protein ligase RNF128 [Anolis carolinensis]
MKSFPRGLGGKSVWRTEAAGSGCSCCCRRACAVAGAAFAEVNSAVGDAGVRGGAGPGSPPSGGGGLLPYGVVGVAERVVVPGRERERERVERGRERPVRAGLASAGAWGRVAVPEGALEACGAHVNFSGGAAGLPEPPWLALVRRGGGCTFSQKINAAALSGAKAAVVFNAPGGQGNEVQVMIHPGTGNTVAIMISYLKGKEILRKMEQGYQVTMFIEVGKKHGPWMNNYSIFFVSVSFFIVTAATVGYFIFYSARRLRIARAQNRKQRRLKADAKKAISQLQLRTLKQGDKETGPDADSCAVCIEVYKPNDVVRILTCNHLFHKNCIDPWLLEHRTCPMCKCDILKALGIEVDIEDGAESIQPTEPSNIPSVPEEDNHSETASSGYASVQGADEPVPEEPAHSESDNLQLVNNNALQPPPVDVLPHLDNPAFEADEAHVQEAKS